MTNRRIADIAVGLKSVRTPLWSSEPAFVSKMQQRGRYLTDALIEILESFRDDSPDIMLEALQPTFELSKELCPELTGELKRSGYLQVTSFRNNPRVEMGYAKGGSPRYAVYVHENVNQRHRAPTQAKWLEVALLRDLDNIERRLDQAYWEKARG